MKIWQIGATTLLWLGLPTAHGLFFILEGETLTTVYTAYLFVIYAIFSWSIAFLAFLLESSRLQLLKKQKPYLIALLLAFYGLLAISLAMITSPWLNTATWNEIWQILSLSLLYCYLAGWIYAMTCLRHNKQQS